MTPAIHELSRQLRCAERSGDMAECERVACILAPLLEPLYDELDDRGILLSWECDR